MIRTKTSLFTIFFLVFFDSLCLAQIAQNLHNKEGIIIHAENRPVSAGGIDITGYRLEKVSLEKPVGMRIGEPPLESVFRIVIVAREPLPRTGRYSIWVDDNQLDAYPNRPNEIAAILYARTLPNNELQLAFSKRTEIYRATRVILPGLLHVPSEYATSAEELEARRPIIKLQRRARPDRSPMFELNIEFPWPCAPPRGGISPYIEIDGRKVITHCNGKQLVAMFMSATDLASMRDGSEIVIVRAVRKETARSVVGRLNKSSVEIIPY